MNERRWHLTLVSAVLVLGLWGCYRDLPTGPGGAVPPSTSPLAAALAEFTNALDDVLNRVLPTFGGGATVEALSSALGDLASAVSQPDRGTVHSALGRARTAVRALQADSANLQDLDVVLLALDGIESAAHGALGTASDPAP